MQLYLPVQRPQMPVSTRLCAYCRGFPCVGSVGEAWHGEPGTAGVGVSVGITIAFEIPIWLSPKDLDLGMADDPVTGADDDGSSWLARQGTHSPSSEASRRSVSVPAYKHPSTASDQSLSGDCTAAVQQRCNCSLPLSVALESLALPPCYAVCASRGEAVNPGGFLEALDQTQPLVTQVLSCKRRGYKI
jgi:hypothetical protein